jgi:hypothetical protein
MPDKSLPVITNNADISLEMAVWLLHDEYDHVKEENYISATGLMKPLRHILLPPRIEEGQRVNPDVEEYIPSALGSSLHAGIEKAWMDGRHVVALRKLGYPESVIERVRVNPAPEELAALPHCIPVYVEQRSIREITVDGTTFKVGGKFDMVCEGRVTDTKSTSVWAWVYGGRDEQYQLQGSIYRWLNPDKITEDFIRINYIFTDWSKADARQGRANYPDKRVKHLDIPLLSIEETEAWIRAKLKQIMAFQTKPEKQLPECSNEELWMSDPKFKYYADPAKALGGAGKSTKNFDNFLEAQAFMQEKGKGTVITLPGAPKRCGYCPAYVVCTQKDKYTFD